MAPAAGSIVGLAPEALQVAQRVVTHEDHLAAPSPIATVGATPGNVRFTAEAGRAIPAGTGPHFDPGAVVKHLSIVTAVPDRRAPTEAVRSISGVDEAERSISGVDELVGEIEPGRSRGEKPSAPPRINSESYSPSATTLTTRPRRPVLN